MTSLNVKPNLAKAARVLLVFALVFWGSFRAETFAFAAFDPADVKGHSEDQLTDLTIYVVDPAPADDNKTGLGDKVAAASDEKMPTEAQFTIAADETARFVAVPSWNGGKPVIDEKTGDVETAAFVEWKVTPEEKATAKVDKETGELTVTAVADGEVTVTCSLTDSAKEKLDVTEFPDKGAAKVTFTGEVTKPAEVSKRITELRVLDEEGNLLTGTGKTFALPSSYKAGDSYTFQVAIKVGAIEGEKETSETYDSLKAARDAGVTVEWSVTKGAAIAQISQEGVLVMNGAGEANVHVDASIGSETANADVVVELAGSPAEGGGSGGGSGDGGGDEPAPKQPVDQGESHPQGTLQVVSNARVSVDGQVTMADAGASASASGEGEGEGEGAASESDAQSSASSASESSASESASSSSSGQAGASSSDAPGASESSFASGGDEGAAASIDKTYTTEQLEALGMARGTYTMYYGNEFTTVTGAGPYLESVLRDIGIENTAQIDTIVFEDYQGQRTTVNWNDLNAANVYYPHVVDDQANLEDAQQVSPMIAISSLVRGYGDGTGEGADAQASSAEEPQASESSSSASASASSSSSSSSSPGSSGSSASASSSSSSSGAAADPLLDNTRFRLLFGSTSPARDIANPDALCSISKITVNVKPNEEQPEDPGYDTPIDVSVEYVPVPIGASAIFMALPNTEIKNARFDFNWEFSADGGKTWEPVENGNVQGLRVVTTQEKVDKGYQYRVTMETDATDANGRENVKVTSEPVTMVEGNGLAVVLEYDPPIAGQTAYFQTTLYGAKSGVTIDYTWQQSQDGGATWRDIAGRTGSTLAVPTEPIDPNAKKDSDEVTPITYVRVIAKETSGEQRVAVSEAVPLTVHVGDSDEGATPETPATATTDDPKAKTDKSDDTKKKPKVTPIDDIMVEGPDDSPRATVPTASGTQTQQVTPSRLYVNDAVSEQVAEQEEAVEEYVQSTVPGARWTSLTTAQATDDDVRNILADNPFAPFVLPLGLGITAAGGVEKLVAFRRQVGTAAKTAGKAKAPEAPEAPANAD